MARQNPPEAGGRPLISNAQIWAAFIFGCLLLAGLVGAAFAGLLPDHLRDGIIRVATAAAGGGFALFLAGYFDLHLPQGIKAGGALGIFVFLLLLNPGKYIPPEVLPTPKILTDCQNNLQNRQFDIAEEFCNRAVVETNSGYRALTYLASAQFNLGKIPTAVTTWARAIEHGADDAVAKYNMAFAYFTDRQYQKSAEFAAEAAAKSDSRTVLRARSLYLEASAESALWNFGSGSEAESHFQKAVQKNREFIDVGSPKYRAYGNLACMYAISGLNTENVARTERFKLALKYIKDALSDLQIFKRPGKVAEERKSFLTTYGPNSNNECGNAILTAWRQIRPNDDYAAQFASLQ